MRTGIFGGTFDPPHVGHLILAAEACSQLALDQVFWLLTPVSPFKQEQAISPVDIRIEMLQAAIAGNPQFVLSRIDIDRPPPHFAADSVSLLQAEFPDHQWIYLLGGDSLWDLPSWHEPQRLLEACTSIGVLHRPGSEVNLEQLYPRLPGLSAKLLWIEAPLLDISASRIRDLVRTGGAYRYYLPPAVHEIIQKYHLYRSGD